MDGPVAALRAASPTATGASSGGGDGFWAFVDPNDPDIVYVEYQGGNILRVRKLDRRDQGDQAVPRAGRAGLPLQLEHADPPEPDARRARSTSARSSCSARATAARRWERISPDLTTNDPAKQQQEESGGLSVDNSSAENHCTIFAIAESPKNPEVIWVGTDDGNVQVTRDGGKTWTNVAKKIAGLPPGTWVSCVEAEPLRRGHRLRDLRRPPDRRHEDLRLPDHRLRQDLAAARRRGELEGYAHVVREDLVKPDLLFLGTELGLFVSLDGGAQWAQFKGDFPPVAVRDLAIHPREHDLIIATHGRGIYILDDLTPLRALTPRRCDAGRRVAAVAAVGRMVIPSSEQRFDGDERVQRARRPTRPRSSPTTSRSGTCSAT